MQDVKNLLLKTYPLTDIKCDGPVVVVDFNFYKIELNPTFKSFWGYTVPIRRDGVNGKISIQFVKKKKSTNQMKDLKEILEI